MMSQVTAVATVHDPNNSLYAWTNALLPRILPAYAGLIACCSSATDPATLDLLDGLGAQVRRETDIPLGWQYLGWVRLAGLRAGIQAGASHIHLCDFDRLLHWQMTYPEELRAVLEAVAAHDFLVLGRTERAFETHPGYEAQTERLTNHVFHLATGQAWDVSGGSRGISHQAGAWLLEHSTEQHFGVDAEWPILCLSQPAFRVGYRPCEGLEFETPDRFPAEVAAAGGVQAWVAQADTSAEEWTRRLQYAHWTAEATLRAVRRTAGQA